MNPNSSVKSKPEVEHVSFRPAKGGIVSETSMKTTRGGQGGGPLHDYGSETAVHGSMAHAVKHLKEKMGHCFGGGEEKEGE